MSGSWWMTGYQRVVVGETVEDGTGVGLAVGCEPDDKGVGVGSRRFFALGMGSGGPCMEDAFAEGFWCAFTETDSTKSGMLDGPMKEGRGEYGLQRTE